MAKKLALNESRHLVRHELIYYLKVNDRQTGLEFGRLGDIHLEGMLLFTPEPLVEKAVYDLLLELPKPMAAIGVYAEMPILAQTRWNRPGLPNRHHNFHGRRFLGSSAGYPMGLPPRTYYSNGLRFLGLDSQAQKVVRLLTKMFSMRGRDSKPQNIFTN